MSDGSMSRTSPAREHTRATTNQVRLAPRSCAGTSATAVAMSATSVAGLQRYSSRLFLVARATQSPMANRPATISPPRAAPVTLSPARGQRLSLPRRPPDRPEFGGYLRHGRLFPLPHLGDLLGKPVAQESLVRHQGVDTVGAQASRDRQGLGENLALRGAGEGEPGGDSVCRAER